MFKVIIFVTIPLVMPVFKILKAVLPDDAIKIMWQHCKQAEFMFEEH